MKILKIVLIIWLSLLGILLALLLFKNVEKTKVYKKIKKLIEDEDDDNKKYN
jgi:hypothetical protein